jgi:hypothetical protein
MARFIQTSRGRRFGTEQPATCAAMSHRYQIEEPTHSFRPTATLNTLDIPTELIAF